MRVYFISRWNMFGLSTSYFYEQNDQFVEYSFMSDDGLCLPWLGQKNHAI